MSVLSDEQKMREAFERAFASNWDESPDSYEEAIWKAAWDAAIAADRAARAEPVAWAAQAGIAAIHAARSGRADNVQIPLSTYPGGDHSVGIYTAPPAAPVVPVVPDDVAKDAERYRWIRKKTHCRNGSVFSFPVIDSLAGVRPGQKTYAERFDACIDEAMLAAAPAQSQETKP